MLLIPVTITAGTETSVELRNAWQRAWAQFRTSQSPIDYVRVSGMGVDPMLVNAAQTVRPGRGWWRNLIDLYGAADILVAEVQLQRAYPGGPARARFIGRHGPDNEIVGGFTLTAPNSDAIPGDDGAGRAAHGPAVRPGARRRPPGARHFAQPAAAAGAGAAARKRRWSRRPRRRQRLSRSRSAARTSTSIISRWRICARCRDRIGNAAADQSRRDQLCAGRLSRRHLASSRRRSARAAGWSRPRGRWSGSTRRPTSRRRFRRRRSRPSRASAAAAPSQSAARAAVMKQGPDQIALPLDWPQSDGDARFIVSRRQSRGVRPFPQLEPVAGQGDDPDRAAAFGPHAARAQLRRAGRRPPVRRGRAARRGGAVPCLEPGAGQRAGR